MSADDESWWSEPWIGRREPQDEAAFVADVSGALNVPDAAPEIRMIAEVMAVLDIPARAERGRTVAQLLEQEREQCDARRTRPRRFPVGRRLAGVAAAAAVAVAAFTVSAYAGVLPDSVQKMAHSVINAPAPKNAQPGPGHSKDAPTPSNGPSNGTPPTHGGQPAGSTTGGARRPAATPSDVATSGTQGDGGVADPSAQPVKTPSPGNGHTRTHNNHSSNSTAPPSAAPPSPKR